MNTELYVYIAIIINVSWSIVLVLYTLAFYRVAKKIESAQKLITRERAFWQNENIRRSRERL
jgi:hypothetical protein